MSKIIKFSSHEPYLDYPKPSSTNIPDWYKKAERYIGGKNILSPETSLGVATVKVCMPFLDGFITGYNIDLWQDLQVTIDQGRPVLRWAGEPKVATERHLSQLQGMPIGSEYHEIHFGWHNPFILNLPKGYSILLTHPLNRLDLPFTTMSGIVDADFVMGPGTLPFLLKKDFEGIIPQGTPIAQIFPFKRDNWESKVDDSLQEKAKKNSLKIRRVASGFYKHNMWKRKTYK